MTQRLKNYKIKSRYEHEETTYNIIEDNDNFDYLCRCIIAKEKGVNIDGPAGTGKIVGNCSEEARRRKVRPSFFRQKVEGVYSE